MVVADSGPLIVLARVQRLEILAGLFGEVLVAPAVAAELAPRDGRPGSELLARAMETGLLRLFELPGAARAVPLPLPLDPGETEALQLALHLGGCLLLLDEKKARRVARMMGLRLTGTAALLVEARRRGLIARVAPVLGAMTAAGYRIAPALAARALELAGEA